MACDAPRWTRLDHVTRLEHARGIIRTRLGHVGQPSWTAASGLRPRTTAAAISDSPSKGAAMLDPIPRRDSGHLGPTASIAAAILNPPHHGVGHLGLSPPRWQPSWTQHLPPPCMEAAILDSPSPTRQPSWTLTPMAAAILDSPLPTMAAAILDSHPHGGGHLGLFPPHGSGHLGPLPACPPPPFPACTGGCGATPPIEPH